VRRRLDAELVRRGLVGSRAEAAEAIAAGLVAVDGRTASKPATLVAAEAPVELTGGVRRYVSRGGEKLEAALDRFSVDPSGLDCLDAGASTGGFTDCLLRHGARRVVAVDVGYGQLAWTLRSDPRVHVLERTNVRDLRQEVLPFEPSLVVADLSFISLRTALPPLTGAVPAEAAFVLLVKPQFEVGREDVGRGGVVRDPAAWRRALDGLVEAAGSAGAGLHGVMPSPLLGPAGNVEFLVHLARGEPDDSVDLDAAVREAEALRAAS